MPSNPVPSLASFLTTSSTKLDQLMTNFGTSNYSQSYCYQGKITSLPYLIATAQYDKDRLQSIVNSALSTYLKRYYDQVDLEVSVDYMDPTTERLDLKVGGIVTDGKFNFDMAGLLRYEGGLFQEWMKDANNGG